MVVQEKPDARQTHLLRGVLDMSVLALLSIEPGHAYAIVERLQRRGFTSVGYGTIYPLVTRLRRQGLVDLVLAESQDGPARNVLSTSVTGRAALAQWREQWERTTSYVQEVMNDLDSADR